MFRNSITFLHFKGQPQLTKALGLLHGRHRYERRLGLNRLLRMTIGRSHYNTEQRRPIQRALRRQVIGATQLESGTDWRSARNDLARHNSILSLQSLEQIAQLEPLAMRSLMELVSSDIQPPRGVDWNKTAGKAEVNAMESMDDELRADIRKMMKPRSALPGSGTGSQLAFEPPVVAEKKEAKLVSEWIDAYKEFAAK